MKRILFGFLGIVLCSTGAMANCTPSTPYDTSCYATNGLILHYDGLNNTGSGNNPSATVWTDLSSQNNNGQFVGTVTYDSTKHGYTFTNNANYVQTLNNIGLTGAVVGTVEIVGTWYGKGNSTINGLWWFGSTAATDNQSLCGQVNAYANVNNYFTFTAPSTNEMHTWDFISSNGNYNGRSVKVDGTTVATSSSSGTMAVTASKMQIGRNWQYGGQNRSFNGVIHAVRVYNRVLTDEEILAHYQLDQMRFGNSVTCSSGTYLPANSTTCSACPANYYCSGGMYFFDENNDQGIEIAYSCSAGTYLPANSTTCVACLTYHTCTGGTYTFDENNDQGITAPGPITCGAGYYRPANSTTCVACPSWGTCAGGTYSFSTTTAQGIVINELINTDLDDACSDSYTFPTGAQSTLNWRAVFRQNSYDTNVLTNSNYANACNVTQRSGLMSDDYDLHSIFRIQSYRCQSGTFLPANTEGCQTCPNDATCAGRDYVGGEYVFNPTESQGIVINDRIHSGLSKACSTSYVFENGTDTVLNWHAVFRVAGYDVNLLTDETNTGACNVKYQNGLAVDSFDLRAVYRKSEYTCSAGTYLPADGIACATCPADSYCGGGTFTFNETTAQGATACDSGTHSPAGSSSASQCIAGYTCTSGQYLPKNTTTCTACPNGYTCAGGTYNLDANNDQGIVANTITINWNGALQSDINANEAGTVTYGGDVRTPVRADPAQIPTGKRFVGWTFRKTNN